MPQPEILVPALNLLRADGMLDLDATRRYATRAAATWVDYFIINGSTTRGDLLDPRARAEVLDVWVEVAGKSRTIACAWTDEDVEEAVGRGLRIMAVLRGYADMDALMRGLQQLPPGALVYSHPMYSDVVLDSEACAAAQELGALPAGGKLAKISKAEIRNIREAVGPDFELWDGSCRDIAGSVAAGAQGVVATPLSSMPSPFPDPRLDGLQDCLNQLQGALDVMPDRAARSRSLSAAAWAAVAD